MKAEAHLRVPDQGLVVDGRDAHVRLGQHLRSTHSAHSRRWLVRNAARAQRSAVQRLNTWNWLGAGSRTLALGWSPRRRSLGNTRLAVTAISSGRQPL